MAGIGSTDDVFPEDLCILCLLDEAWDVGDEKIGKEAEAASMAREAAMGTLDRLGWRAVEEYFRSTIATGCIPERLVIPRPPTKMSYLYSEYVVGAIRYRAAATLYSNDDRRYAIEDMSRSFTTVINGANNDSRLLARASVAALLLHLNGKRYKGKNLVTYSVKWICSAVESGFATESDLDEYLSSMILLVRGDEDEASIAKMLKRNGFGGYSLPASLNEDADIADFFDMDFQYCI